MLIDHSIKSMGTKGGFAGYASVFDIKDSQQEIICAGAFNRTLNEVKQSKEFPKMLWQHDVTKPIGVWTSMTEDAYGLFVRGELCLESSLAQGVLGLIKQGAVTHLSIGYRIKKSRYDSFRKAKIIEDLDLIEISVVTFASNSMAKIQFVKDFNN